jgi:hypothetical protein
MEIRHSQPSRMFAVTGGGAGVDDRLRCRHDMPVLSLHLLSERQGQAPEDIGILIPECTAANLFGAAIAQVQAHAGAEAAEQMVTDMLAARDHALEQITQRAAAHPDPACCEAGATTGGREHTCRRDPNTPS